MTLFYIDIDAFFCAITAVQKRELRGRPFVVSHRGATARILSASAEARRLGVRRGDALSVARKKQPDLNVEQPDFRLFERAATRIAQTLAGFAPRMEPRGYGRFVLDMRGMHALYPRLPDTACRIRQEIQRITCLDSHFGIAENKLVGAIAAKESQLQKEALMLVPAGDEAGFLSPLPCRAMPEWRYRRIREHLRDLNMTQIQHIQLVPRSVFCLAVGPFAAALHEHAFGIDLMPVTPPAASENLAANHAFTPPTNDDHVLRAELFHLVERLGFQLRRRELGTDEIQLFMRFRDGLNRRRRQKCAFCQNDLELYREVRKGFQAMYNRRQAVQQIAISLNGLAPFHRQLELFPTPDSRQDELQAGLDAIRRRFGVSSIRYGQFGVKRRPPLGDRGQRPRTA